MPFPRSSGVLLHPTSLPGPHGIGDLGDQAYQFVDKLAASSQSLWQMLPLGPTGAANSPYQALSSFAGNPLLISLERVAKDGLLTEAELAADKPDFAEATVDFQTVRTYKTACLRQAVENFRNGKSTVTFKENFAAFREKQAGWLDDFSLFMALKGKYDGKAWSDWPDLDLVTHQPAAIKAAQEALAGEVEFHAFCQYLFFLQWEALRGYANERQIRLMGDVPIYVAHDSADVWGDSEFFKLDEKGAPTSVAGVPPDYFCPTGQLWGNPIYDWKALKADGYKWWIRRIQGTLAMVDILRIDHYRGFEAYWEVPAGEETAINGAWIPGPGADFFQALQDALGSDLPVIAEDLGTITPEVHALRTQFGTPGMKVLQFGFHEGAQMYLPHTYETNCVAYAATHDNDTTVGWYKAESADYAHMDPNGLSQERDRVRRYLGRDGSDIAWDLIRLLLMSVPDTAVIQFQDLLSLDNYARMNRPGTSEGQWAWRMTNEQLDAYPVDRLKDMTWIYDRAPEQQK